MRFILTLLICFCTMFLRAQVVEVVKFDAIESILHAERTKVTVINFWATWCAPCIKELGFFEELRKENQEVEVVLISMDFADHLEKVEAFVERKGLKSRILLLDDVDYNSWIDKVESSWSGAIPATLILDAGSHERIFIAGEITKEELSKSVNTFINHK